MSKSQKLYLIDNTMNKNKGFTLLVAVAVTSMLLIVSFVVSNVALKQILLSSANQESQHAFYNADSGTECAIYWDLRNTNGTSAFALGNPSAISCNGSAINTVISAGSGTVLSYSDITFNLSHGCAAVRISKNSDGSTTVDSKGYNNCAVGAQRRFERGITLTYD